MFNLIFVLMKKKFYDFSELDVQVRVAGPESTLFDFVALGSCANNRELMFNRLRSHLFLENYSFVVIYKTVLGVLREGQDFSRLLRFCVKYYEVPSGLDARKEFLASFNNWYGCDLQMSDYDFVYPILL